MGGEPHHRELIIIVHQGLSGLPTVNLLRLFQVFFAARGIRYKLLFDRVESRDPRLDIQIRFPALPVLYRRRNPILLVAFGLLERALPEEVLEVSDGELGHLVF